jgi:hypothetical protein
LGVLKYFYLSLPLLLVQVFIDFGYTIGLIFGVSSMHRRSGGAPSDGASFGSLSSASDLPPTAARFVSPTRGHQQRRADARQTRTRRIRAQPAPMRGCRCCGEPTLASPSGWLLDVSPESD